MATSILQHAVNKTIKYNILTTSVLYDKQKLDFSMLPTTHPRINMPKEVKINVCDSALTNGH